MCTYTANAMKKNWGNYREKPQKRVWGLYPRPNYIFQCTNTQVLTLTISSFHLGRTLNFLCVIPEHIFETRIRKSSYPP